MEIQVSFTGAVGLQMIVQNAGPLIGRLWDGSMQHVVFVLEKPPNALEVRFAPNRAKAIGNLRRIALTLAPPLDGVARKVADDWERVPAAQGLECIVVGWGTCQLMEMNPDDLKTLRDQPVPSGFNEFAARVALLSQTREGALDVVHQLRATLTANGREATELDALERAIAESWEDAAALSLVAARAANAIGPTSGAVSQTTTVHIALTLMADAFGNRAATVTGGGGDA